MGILIDEYPRADRGDSGYGFKDFEDAMSTQDPDCPDIGMTFKILGRIYELQTGERGLEFVEFEE